MRRVRSGARFAFAPERHVRRNLACLQRGERGVIAIADIGQHLARIRAKGRADAVDQGQKRPLIGRTVGEPIATMTWECSSTAIWPL
jgi:hypothetical protein